MKTIYKFPLEISSEYTIIDVPKDAQFLHVAEQQSVVCLWAIVDSEAPMVKRHIRIIGTGLDAGDVKIDQYIGSILLLNGTYVFHIFDAGEITH